MLVPKSADPKSVRFWNERLVMDVLRTQEVPLRVAQLAELTGLTTASLGHVLRGLKAKGWVAPTNCKERRRGRPAQRFALACPEGCVLGFDLGFRAARVVRMDLLGNVIARFEVRLRGVPSDERRMTKLAYLLEAVLPADAGPVWVVGCATGADYSDRRQGGAVAPKGWDPVALLLRQFRAEGLRADLVEVGDAHAAAVAAQSLGAACGRQDMLYVHLGWKPKFCLVTDGGVRRGAHGRAGQLRAQTLMPGVDDMPWPKWAREELDDGRFRLVEEALAKERSALARVDEYLAAVAPHVGFVAAVVDPDVVVVGGAFSPLGQRVSKVMGAVIEQQTGHPTEVVGSGLDQFDAATGAALIARREALELLISPETGAQECSADALHRLWDQQATKYSAANN